MDEKTEIGLSATRILTVFLSSFHEIVNISNLELIWIIPVLFKTKFGSLLLYLNLFGGCNSTLFKCCINKIIWNSNYPQMVQICSDMIKEAEYFLPNF